jgi:type II secretory pathway pseudopilin PulG
MGDGHVMPDQMKKRARFVGLPSVLTRRRVGGRWAFSLVELLVILIIIGIISAMAIPRFSESIGTQRIEAAARRVAADLALARSRAKMSSADVSVLFTIAADNYTLPAIEDIDHPARPYTVNLADPPYEVSISAADFGGDAEIIFDGYGEPDSGGSVTVSLGDRLRTISVDADPGRPTISESTVIVPPDLPAGPPILIK